MEQRRVLYVAKTATGGSAFSLYYMVRGLDTTRYKPYVVFHHQRQPYIGQKLSELGLPVITLTKQRVGQTALALQPSKRRDIGGWLQAHVGWRAAQAYIFLKDLHTFARRDVPQIRPIVQAIRCNSIDLVHLNAGLLGSKPGLIAAWLTHKPCICHVHMIEKLKRFDRLFARFAGCFVYVSTAVAQGYIEQGVPAAKGLILHNAIDLDVFTAGDADQLRVRGEWGWTERERVIGIVGRLDWWKGHEYFLEALAEVIKQHPKVRGVIAGEPENTPVNQDYYQRLRALWTALGLEDKVIFTGFRSDIPQVLASLDGVVLSSSEPEPFGMVVIEGMAAGKPVIATAAGGVLDIIQDGVNGVLVPPKDSHALAAAILALLADPERTARISRAGRSTVEEKFTVPRQVSALQSIYDTLIGGRRWPQWSLEEQRTIRDGPLS